MPDVYSATDKKTETHMMVPKELAQEIIRRVGETPRRACGGAYIVSPGKRFINEQEDEEVLLLLRAHPITNLKWIIAAVGWLVISQTVLFLNIFVGVSDNFIFVARMVTLLLLYGYVFLNFLKWYYSVLIVTNERVVDIDFLGVLNIHITHAGLNKIEEKSLVKAGLLQSIFHYGTVDISTAAEVQGVEIVDVPFPDKVLRIIDELSEELEKRRERGL